MSTTGPMGWKNKLELCKSMYKGNDADKKKAILQQINYHSAGLIRTMQKRKTFINYHPKKLELTRQILDTYADEKIITFSNNVKMAESIESGNFVYTGKTTKKKGRVMIEDFLSGNIKHLHTVQKVNEGLDIPDASIAIILGLDSSETKAVQRRGRVTRAWEGKVAKVFNLVIKDTVEQSWFKNAHKRDITYKVIDENGLNQVLQGNIPEEYKPKISEYKFRF